MLRAWLRQAASRGPGGSPTGKTTQQRGKRGGGGGGADARRGLWGSDTSSGITPICTGGPRRPQGDTGRVSFAAGQFVSQRGSSARLALPAGSSLPRFLVARDAPVPQVQLPPPLDSGASLPVGLALPSRVTRASPHIRTGWSAVLSSPKGPRKGWLGRNCSPSGDRHTRPRARA